MSQLDPVLRFKSHIEGKNADVEVWPDRIEWSQNVSGGAGRTAGRWTAAAMTVGLSLLATGIKGRHQSANMIPMRLITGVTTQRRGVGFTAVRVTTASDAIEFRVTKGDADHIRATIASLVAQGPTPAPAPMTIVEAPTHSVAPADSVADELKKFAELRDAGVLSAEEFDAQKARLLRSQ